MRKGDGIMWKPMLPKLSEEVPVGEEWMYEVKYDGFRALLTWEEHSITLTSRNGKDLTPLFPEVIQFCNDIQKLIQNWLPVQLDGELVVLNSPLQANFSLIQLRGRLGQQDKIAKMAKRRPATFIAFDLLEYNKEISSYPFLERKKKLISLMEKLHITVPIHPLKRIGFTKSYSNFEELWNLLVMEYGEGIIAKRKTNRYEHGKRVDHWLKIKNWRKITGVVTQYDVANQYFSLNVLEQEDWKEIGVFKHGLKETEFQSITNLMMQKGSKAGNNIYKVPPAITVQINCLHVDEKQIREPMFDTFRFDLPPEQCTFQKLKVDLAMIPEEVEITNPDKPMWPDPLITKQDLIIYLRKIAPFILPRLQNKKATLIRYPHGITDTSFYQKHRAENSPTFVEKHIEGDEVFLLINNVEALVWIGNQGTIEIHVPFQKVNDDYPDEIVLDLDPPSRDQFSLAITAAQLVKEMCDYLNLISFVKTSGNKGLQIHIPLPKEKLTFTDTRAFTEAVAKILVEHHPKWFTIERLKKKRGNRLYIDYVQHAEGKTIVAPYSPRATKEGTVSAPLFWEEVTETLLPTDFTILNIVERVNELGCPWSSYDAVREEQDLTKLLQLIRNS